MAVKLWSDLIRLSISFAFVFIHTIHVSSGPQVNVSNLVLIVTELFGENVVRGRGILARAIITAQSASPTFSHVYAALVAIINTKFPQNGELILKRLIIAFRKGFKRYEIVEPTD